MYMSLIGENLKKYRMKAGFTQKEVEARLELRELMMKDLETERLKLPAELAISLSALYKVSLDELLTNKTLSKDSEQMNVLSQLKLLFKKSEIDLLFMDPVIRAHLEEYQDQVLDLSLFDLISIDLTEKQKKDFSSEILKTLGSLMGVDGKVTRDELDFLNNLISSFGLDEKAKSITKTITNLHTPSVVHFHNRPAAKHFLIWLMFYMSKSDGNVSHQELAFIETCAETLKVNRSNFVFIKKFFNKEKY